MVDQAVFPKDSTANARGRAADADARPFCVVCEQVLPPAAGTGRPRLTCSTSCRRQLDRAREKVIRRLETVLAWHDERGAGRYADAEVDQEIACATEELVVLLARDTGRSRR